MSAISMRLDAPFWATLVACALATSCVVMLTIAARAAGIVG